MGMGFALTSGKTVVSVKLPSNRNVVFLGVGFGETYSAPSPIVPYIPGVITDRGNKPTVRR